MTTRPVLAARVFSPSLLMNSCASVGLLRLAVCPHGALGGVQRPEGRFCPTLY